MSNIYKEGFDSGYEIGREDGVRSCELTQTGMILKMVELILRKSDINGRNTLPQKYVDQIDRVLDEVEKNRVLEEVEKMGV